MADLFEAAAPAAAKKPVPLHSDTQIYAAAVDLNKYIARATSDFRRDIKPTYGRMLVEEGVWLSVLIREANIARAGAKLKYFDEIQRQIEIIQFVLRTLHDLGADWLPQKTFSDSLPLTASVAAQAAALRDHFAPAP